jgi:hypothetical protein
MTSMRSVASAGNSPLRAIAHWLSAEPTRIPSLLLGLCVAGMWLGSGPL